MNYTPPEPNPYVDVPLYTEAKLRSEVEKARREAIEEAAKEADYWYELNKSHRCGDYIAAAIRGLK